MSFPWRMHLSWLVLAIGGLWGASTAHRPGGPGGSTILTALLTGYILWALYWGLPPFWRWWRRFHTPSLLSFLPGGCVLRAGIAFGLLVAGGYFFSVFGGGLYHFSRYLRGARYHA